jgi:hypothetical protein
MCVQCVMGAAAGFGVFQAYRFVIAGRARRVLGLSTPEAKDTEATAANGSTAEAADDTETTTDDAPALARVEAIP